MEELASNVGVIERLQSFQYKDAKGKDWGLNVRQRAKELCSLVTDPDRIRQERSKVGSRCHRLVTEPLVKSQAGSTLLRTRCGGLSESPLLTLLHATQSASHDAGRP